jgi:hypothetical protein
MTTVADDPYFPARTTPSVRVALVSWASVPIALLAIPAFMLGGWPFAGWWIAVVLWLVNRGIQIATTRFVIGLPQTVAVGVAGIGFLTRIWGTMIALVLTVHWAGKDVAVPVAVLFLLLYTADMLARGLAYAESRRVRPPTTRGTA